MKIYEESSHGLTWAEFVEVGCPAKKEDYFLTEKDILSLDIVKKQRKEIFNKIDGIRLEEMTGDNVQVSAGYNGAKQDVDAKIDQILEKL